jgi:hypothetical protein
MGLRAPILLFATVAALAGCSRIHYGIFISTVGQDVTLEVRQLESDGQFHGPERYTLRGGKSTRAVCLIAELTAKDSNGRVLFQQVLPFRPDADKYQKPDEREIYYLVTTEGAYPIPREWREAWKEHQREIIANFFVNAARERLVKLGELRK